MSRAFVKEAEAPEPHCPERLGCGGAGIPVGPVTLAAQLPAERAATLMHDAFWCPNPQCDVAYFDASGGVVYAAEARHRGWPKDPAAAVCACFGIDEARIMAWARAPGAPDKAAMRALLARIAGPDARCATCSPDGRSCETAVRRVFLRGLETRSDTA